jgi:hypothetical protein
MIEKRSYLCFDISPSRNRESLATLPPTADSASLPITIQLARPGIEAWGPAVVITTRNWDFKVDGEFTTESAYHA